MTAEDRAHHEFHYLMATPEWEPAFNKHVRHWLHDSKSNFRVPGFVRTGDRITFIARHAGQPDMWYDLYRDAELPFGPGRTDADVESDLEARGG